MKINIKTKKENQIIIKYLRLKLASLEHILEEKTYTQNRKKGIVSALMLLDIINIEEYVRLNKIIENENS